MKRLLPVFSYVFHPLFIPVYATLFYLFITRNFFFNNEIYLIFIQVLLITLLLPLSVFYLLRSLGFLKSAKLLGASERRVPLLIYALLLFILLKHSFTSFVLPELYYFFAGILVSVLLSIVFLLFKIRVSLHTMGMVSLIMFIISLSFYYYLTFLNLIAFCVICLGFVASSRLKNNYHTILEILLGGLLGFLPQAILWRAWLITVL